MKYYGMKYEGNIDIYNVEKAIAFDNPYDALANADSKWSIAYASNEARLLVVFREETTANPAVENNAAFFDFSSVKSCKSFISDRNEITWSSMYSPIWNGDGKHMIPNSSL